MAEKTKSINLLPNKGESLVDLVLSWALTIGRLLIILTETLALSIFLYRFSLDVKIADLHDLIKNKSAIVSQFRDTELTARNLQARLAIAQKLDAKSTMTVNAFSDIIELGRGQVTFKNLIASSTGVHIDVQGANSASLNTFVNRLKNYPNIKSINIDSVENKTDTSLIEIQITANLKST